MPLYHVILIKEDKSVFSGIYIILNALTLTPNIIKVKIKRKL